MQTIELVADLDDGELEVPFAGARAGDDGRQAVDLDAPHRGAQQTVDPARLDIGLERLAGRRAHAVEPQRLVVAFLHAEHGLARVLEQEALRRGEGEAQPRMREFAAAHEAFIGIVAESEAGDRGEIAGAIARSDAGRADLPRRGDRLGDAIGRRGMRRQYVEIGRSASCRRARRAARPICRARRGSATRRKDRSPRARRRARRWRRPRAPAGARSSAKERRCEARTSSPFCLLWMTAAAWLMTSASRSRSARSALWRARHMGDLMRHHRGRLGGVAGERQKAARDVEIAARQREGVDDRRVEDGHLIGGLARRVARLRELDQNVVEIALGGGEPIFAAELRDQLLVLGARTASRRRRRAARRTAAGREARAGVEHLALALELRAAAGRERERRDERARDGAARPDQGAAAAPTISICAGETSSMRGP